mmetsp:Transcript_47824/g.111546  ORF Transcript_47824/g.111546 Transcript_47824/m.111546 type:complete len:745 (+) Transcript_47824:45-2279(+)
MVLAEEQRVERLHEASAKLAGRASTLYIYSLAVAVVSIILTLVVVHNVIDPLHGGLNTENRYEDKLDDGDKIRRDIAEHTIPDSKAYYRSLKGSLLEETMFTAEDPALWFEANATCLMHWQDVIVSMLPSDMTNPALIQEALFATYLETIPEVRRALRDYLRDPQPIIPLLERSASCLGAVPGIQRLACDAITNSSLHLQLSPMELSRLVHVAIVLNELTIAMVMNDDIRAKVAEVVRYHVPDIMRKGLDAIPTEELRAFAWAKYSGVAEKFWMSSLSWAADPAASIMHSHAYRDFLQLNILEAVKLDFQSGFDSNARVGIALAATVPGLPPAARALAWTPGRDWIDAYNSWNLAFAMGWGNMLVPTKLLIPAYSCVGVNTEYAGHDGDWLMARAGSLAVGLVLSLGSRFDDILASNSELIQAAGDVNRKFTLLQEPDTDMVEKMLAQLCMGMCHGEEWSMTGSVVTAALSESSFRLYVGMIQWFTVIGTGFGLEALFGPRLSSHLREPSFTVAFGVAEMLFPLFATIALGGALTQSVFTLPFLVLGLWKFGFPDTLLYLHLALHKCGGPEYSRWSRASDLFNGIGTCLHHSAAALFISLMCWGVIQFQRESVACIMPLVLQHWLDHLTHRIPLLYSLLVVLTEVWFEWEVLSSYEEFFNNHEMTRVAAAGMLCSHWLYCIAALCSIPGLVPMMRMCKRSRLKAKDAKEMDDMTGTRPSSDTASTVTQAVDLEADVASWERTSL